MERQPISSSNIISAGYDPAQQILEIEFKSGVVWQYAGVPEYVWFEFLGAPSQGKYFNSQILPQFGSMGFRVQ